MSKRHSAAIAVCAALGSYAHAGAQVDVRAIMVSDEALPLGGTVPLFSAPDLNAAGEVAFLKAVHRGRLASEAYVTSNGVVTPIELPGAVAAVSEIVLGDGGEVILLSLGINGSELVQDLWMYAQGSAGRVIGAGASAPGIKGAEMQFIGAGLAMNPQGQVAFDGTLRRGPGGIGEDNDTALWSFTSGSTSLVAHADAQAFPGALFTNFTPPVINNSGQMAWGSLLRAASNGSYIGNGAFIGNVGGGTATQITRTGLTAPGTGKRFELLYAPDINNAGDLAFSAFLRRCPTCGIGADNDTGVWTYSGGVLRAVAATGHEAPGLNGATFHRLLPPAINGAGEIAFPGYLQVGGNIELSNDAGVWVARPDGSMELLAREGRVAPGTSGALFSTFDGGTGDHAGLNINIHGDVAFTATLRSGKSKVHDGNDGGLWVYSRERDELILIVREGDPVDVNGKPRIVSAIWFARGSGLEDGRAAGLNNAGQIAFSLDFTDGTGGVFIATLPPPCAGDLDGDGDADPFDLQAFLDAWHAGDPAADLNGDGRFTGRDVSAFVHTWIEGCP